MPSTSLVSGGFYITRLLDRPPGLGDGLLPDRLLTLSSCLTKFFPDVWAIEWASSSEDERVSAVESLGLPREALPAIIRYATEAERTGDLGCPVWQSMSAARDALARFGGSPAKLVAVELAVPSEVAVKLLADLAPRHPQEAPCGLYTRLKAGVPPDRAGTFAGWEILGHECGGDFHSWLCNSLEDEAAARLGIRPGALGLLSTERDARAVVKLIDSGLGAEPALWFPALLHLIE